MDNVLRVLNNASPFQEKFYANRASNALIVRRDRA